MSQVSYCTRGFNDRDVEAALDAIAAAGFARAEILGQAPHVAAPPEGRELETFRSRLEQRRLAGGTVHAPLARDLLAAPHEQSRRENITVLASYVRFAAAIGARGLVIHPVPNPNRVPDAGHPEASQRIRDAVRRSLDELVPIAQESGVRILLENLPWKTSLPLFSMKQLRPLVDGYPDVALGLVIDTGHAWTAGIDPVEEILEAGSRLWSTHLQDVDFDQPQDNHWVPTQGGLDWNAIRAALASVGYAGLWTFEVGYGRHGESREQLARLSRHVAAEWGFGSALS